MFDSLSTVHSSFYYNTITICNETHVIRSYYCNKRPNGEKFSNWRNHHIVATVRQHVYKVIIPTDDAFLKRYECGKLYETCIVV